MATPPNADEVKLKNLTLERITYLQQPEELGRGAYGKVYSVKYGGVKCAAKELHDVLIQARSEQGKMEFRQKFIDECDYMKSLVHPNIVRFIGIIRRCNDSQFPVMVMELMDKSLTKFIEGQQNISSTMKGSILIDVAQGLEYLHTRSIIHRDLSPNNVLLKHQAAEIWVAKISDFGMAKIIDATSNVKQTPLPGTPDFMPPEALVKNPCYTTSLDVFSYGGNILFVASCDWPTPSDQVKLDPDTQEPMKYYNEVERRQKFIDMMSGDMVKLKPMVISCLDNKPDKRPTMKIISKDLKKMFGNRKSEEDSEYLDLDLSDDHSKRAYSLSASEQDATADLPWFMGPFPDKETEGALNGLDDGVFFVRKINKIDEKYEICLRWKQQTQHIAISMDQFTNYCCISPGKYFATIDELIQYYTVNSLSSVIAELDTTLNTPYWNQYGPNPDQKNSDDLENKPKGLRRLTHTLGGFARGSPKKVKQNRSSENYDDNDEDSPKLLRAEQSHSLMIPVEIELWYYDNLTRFDVIQLLKADGDYLVRFSEKKQCYVLTTKSKDECLHIPIQKLKLENGCKYGFEGPAFFTIGDLLKHYVENQIPIAHHIILKRPVCKEAAFDDLKQHIISHDDITLDKQPVSKGIFGDVYSAQLKKPKAFESVTVKKCNTEYTKNQFLYEAKILKLLFGHPNIINLLGVCVHREPVYIVMENVDGKNFECFLDQHGPDLSPNQLAELSMDAAQGMEYLASKNCIHCDLAARNCIFTRLKYHQILKISDFSLCQLTKDGSYIPRQLKDVPFEWMSPEVIKIRKFTSASDVWSYGVLLFEIYSGGVSKPCIGENAEDAYRCIKEGYRLDAPKGTPDEIVEVMKNCWEFKADKRPTFEKIVSTIKCFLYTLLHS